MVTVVAAIFFVVANTFPFKQMQAPVKAGTARPLTACDATENAKAVAAKAVTVGNYTEAIRLLENSRNESALQNDCPAVRSSVLLNLADAYEQIGMWRQAVDVLKDAEASATRAFGSKDVQVAYARARLGSALVTIGDLDGGGPILRAAVDAESTAPNCLHSEYAFALSLLAVLEVNLHHFPEADRASEHALSLVDAKSTAPADYISVLSVIGGLRLLEGESARALPVFNRAIAIVTKTLGADNVRIGPLLVYRGLVEAADHKYGASERDMESGIRVIEQGRNDGSADWARLLLGRVYLDEGKTGDAERVLPDALVRERKLLGAANPRLAASVRQLARLRAQQHNYDEAAALYREALGMIDAQNRSKAQMTANNRSAGEKEVRKLEKRAQQVFGQKIAI